MKTIKPTFNDATLITLLTTTFAFNLARIKCLALIILALVETPTPEGIVKLIVSIVSSQRTWRPDISSNSVSQILLLLQIYILIIYPLFQTIVYSWKFGKKDCNILYLAAAYQGIAIPLFILS